MLFKVVPNAQVAKIYFFGTAVLLLMILHMLVVLAAANVLQIRTCLPHPPEASAKHVQLLLRAKQTKRPPRHLSSTQLLDILPIFPRLFPFHSTRFPPDSNPPSQPRASIQSALTLATHCPCASCSDEFSAPYHSEQTIIFLFFRNTF